MRRTLPYNIPVHEFGENYSATADRETFGTIDNQMAGISFTVGDGVISGWEITTTGLNFEISAGSGLVDLNFIKTLSEKDGSLTDDAVNRIYMVRGSEGNISESSKGSLVSGTPIDSTVPATPTGFSVSTTTKAAIVLVWNANTESDFDHYNLYRSTDGATYTIVDNTLKVLTYTDGDLDEATTYYYRLTAVDLSGNESTPASVSGTTQSDLDPPLNPTETNIYVGNGSVSLTWRKSATLGVTGYEAVINELDSGGNIVGTSTSSFGNVTSALISSLKTNRRYDFILKAINPNSVRSSGVTLSGIIRGATVAQDILSLTGTATATSISLSWSANPAVELSHYLLSVDKEDSFGEQVDIGTVTSYVVKSSRIRTREFETDQVTSLEVIEPLKANTDYVVRIVSVDANGKQSSGAYFKIRTAATQPPGNPRSFLPFVGDTKVDLSWLPSSSSGVITYLYSQNEGSGYTSDLDIGNITEYNVTGLTNGVEVQFRLKSVDLYGNISSGAVISATPVADTTAPDVPADFAATSGNREAFLTWGLPSQVDLAGFNIYRRLLTDANYTKIATVGVLNNYLDLELDPTLTYVYAISSLDASGNESNVTDPQIVTPNDNSLLVPVDNFVATVSGTAIKLTWDLVVGTFKGYNIYRSTKPYTEFELIETISPTISSYNDTNLVGGTTYYYYIVTYTDNADLDIRTGLTVPDNSLLLYTVTTSGASVKTTVDERDIIINLNERIETETQNRLLVHSHFLDPTNLVEMSMLDEITLESSDNLTYTTSSNDVVGTSPDLSFFQVKVNGVAGNNAFQFSDNKKSITFSDALSDGDVVTVHGARETFYVQGVINDLGKGFQIAENGVVNSELDAFVDRDRQIIILKTAASSENTISIFYDPEVPEFQANADELFATKINLANVNFVGNFESTDYITYVTTDSFDDDDVAFVKINGEEPPANIAYSVDASTKSVKFTTALYGSDNSPFDSPPTVFLITSNRSEVKNYLSSTKYSGLHGSQFEKGKVTRELIAPINHNGRILENASPDKDTVTSGDNFVYALDKSLGSTLTIYSLIEVEEGSSGKVIAGTNQGVMISFNYGASWENFTFPSTVPVKKIIKDFEGYYYFVTHRFIYRSLDLLKWTTMSGLDTVSIIHDIIEDDNQNMFIATDIGVFKYPSELRVGEEWFQTDVFEGAITEVFTLAKVPNSYYETPDYDYEEYRYNYATGQYDGYSINDNVSTILAGTEIGVFRTINAGDEWIKFDTFDEPAYGLLAKAKDDIYVHSTNNVYHTANYFVTNEEIFQSTDIDEDAILDEGNNTDVALGTKNGFYILENLTDGFVKYDIDWNRKSPENAVFAFGKILDNLIVSFEGIMRKIDKETNEHHILVEFVKYNTPTVLINNVTKLNGYTYDFFTSTFYFRKKRLATDTVKIISDYTIFTADYGKWSDIDPFATVKVFVNRALKDSSLYSVDAATGIVTFSSTLEKGNIVTISVIGVTLKNEGTLTHAEVDDKLELENSGHYKSFSNAYLGDLVQAGLANEHNFLPANDFVINSGFFIMGRPNADFDTFNSTIDYEEKAGHEGTYSLTGLPRKVVKVLNKLWVVTEKGIFVFNDSFEKLMEVKTINGETDIRDLVLIDNLIVVVTKDKLFTSTDGSTWTENSGSNLPDELYSFTFFNGIYLLGTVDGVYYANNVDDENFGIWNEAQYFDSEFEQVETKGPVYSITSPNFAYSFIGDIPYKSTDGAVWNAMERVGSDNFIVNRLIHTNQNVFAATNYGLYYQNGPKFTQAEIEAIPNETEFTDIFINEGVAYAVDVIGNVHNFSDVNNINTDITDNIDTLSTLYVNKTFVLNGYNIYEDQGGFYVKIQDISSGLKRFNPGEVYQISSVEAASEIKKLSLYLDPRGLDGVAYTPYYGYGYEYGDQSFNFILSVYESDAAGTIGTLIYTRTISSSEVPFRGWHNFVVDFEVNGYFAIGLKMADDNVTSENYLLWGYDFNPEDGSLVVVKKESGVLETLIDRQMLFNIYIESASVDTVNQRAATLPAKQEVVTHSQPSDFVNAEFYHTSINPSTGKVTMDYPEALVSLILDMSGSMTWNDPNNERHEFMKRVIQKYVSDYPEDVRFDLIAYGGRKVNSIDMNTFGTNLSGYDVKDIRIVRKEGSFPTDENDGTIIFEGRTNSIYKDTGTEAGKEYFYKIFIIDSNGIFNEGSPVRANVTGGSPPTNVGKFEATENEVADPDLGVRKVTLSWLNPTGFDYNRIIIRRSEFDYPANIDDGDAVFDNVPSGQQQSFVDNFSFVTDKTYYYSVFTRNSDGLYNFVENLRQDSVAITALDRSFEHEAGGTPPPGLDLTPPGPVTLLSGATSPFTNKVTFTLPSGAAGAKIHWATGTNEPVVTDNGISGTFLTEGNITEYIHRYLDNNVFYSYTVFAYDTNRNLSAGVSVTVKPQESDTNTFPQALTTNNASEISGGEDVILSWMNPPAPSQVKPLYFDDALSYLSSISFKDNIETDSTEILTFDKTISFLGFSEPFGTPRNATTSGSANVPEKLTLSEDATEDNLIKFESTDQTSDDIAAADLAIIQDTDILQTVNTISISTKSTVSTTDADGADVYRLESPSTSATFLNPFKMRLSNVPSQGVKRRRTAREQISDADPLTGDLAPEIEELKGVYARLGETFKVTAELTYKGLALEDEIPVEVEVFDARDITVAPSNTDPYTKSVPGDISQNFRPLSESVTVQSTVTDELDSDENPTGNTLVESLAFIEVGPSDNVGDVFIRVIANYRGYKQIEYIGPVSFASPLDISFTPNVIVPDEADIKQQQATVLLGRVNEGSSTPIDNGTVVKWELIPFDVSGMGTVFGKADPVPPPSFFSTDNVGRSAETYSVEGSIQATVIYSSTQNGLADQVFVGPMPAFPPHRATTSLYGARRFGVNSFRQVVLKGEGKVLNKEVYILRATVEYQGLTAEYESFYEITSGVADEAALDSKLFAVMEEEGGLRGITQYIWGDGRDTARFIVIADPQNDTQTGTFGGANFISCLTTTLGYPVVVLPNGHAVDIEAEGFKVITDFGEELDTNQVTIIEGVAIVELSMNAFIGPPPEKTNTIDKEQISTECHGSFFPLSTGDYPPAFPVVARTSVYTDTKELILRGGGEVAEDSTPPAMVRVREPLTLNSLFARRNNTPVTNHPPDGFTRTEIVCDVSFAGELVPIGTKIQFEVGLSRNDKLALLAEEETTEFTKLLLEDASLALETTEGTVVHEVIDGEMRSVAITVVKPIDDIFIDNITITATTDFDFLEEVSRSISKDLKLSVGGVSIGLDNDWLATKILQAYDPSSNTWERKRDMNVPRQGAIAHTVNDLVYTIGGFRGIYENSVEEYHPVEDAWVEKQDMPTRRGNAMSVVHNDKIYVIGGEGISPDIAMKSLEVYDPALDEWTILEDMPAPVSVGIAEVIGDEIFVFGGAALISSKNSVVDINPAIYKYDITTGVWSTVDTQIVSDYIRMGASSYVDGTDIVVFGGSPPFSQTYLETMFKYDTVANTFTDLSTEMPFGKSLGTGVKSVDKIYNVGGSAGKSRQLNSTFVYNDTSDTWIDDIAKMEFALTNTAVATKGSAASDIIYSVGGGGSGHDPGWVKISVTASPTTVVTNGRESSFIEVEMTDDSGDAPERPVRVNLNGYLFNQSEVVKKTQTLTAGDIRNLATIEELSGDVETPTEEQTIDELLEAATGYEPNQERQDFAEAAPLISLLPVIFSEDNIITVDGIGTSELMPRSDDILPQAKDLTSFATSEEVAAVPSETENKLGGFTVDEDGAIVVQVGEVRSAYTVAVEATVDDDFYYGKTDTLTLLSAPVSSTTETQTSSFSTIPPLEDQELSAQVSYKSDETWLPTIFNITEEPTTNTTELIAEINKLKNTIPYGGSPAYDAMTDSAIRSRNSDYSDLTLSMIATTDNDPNANSSDADGVISEVNETRPQGDFPVFLNTFVITDPISLSARRARTDVIDIEKISEETDGVSFSVSHGSFLDTIINRTVKEGSGSAGRGTVLNRITLDDQAFIQFVRLVAVEPGTSTAQIRYRTSTDGYNFGAFSEYEDANQTILLTDVFAKVIEYEVEFRTQNFEVPQIVSVAASHTVPTIQTLFTNAIQTSAPVIEIALASNGTVPDGAKIEMGIANSDITDFHFYSSDLVPLIQEGGKMTLLNRRYQASSNEPSNEVLTTTDGRTYAAPYGPWPYDSAVEVRRNGSVVDGSEYRTEGTEGLILFKKRQALTDEFTLNLTAENTFRVGLKITNNSSLETAVLDEFGFIYNTADGRFLGETNRLPEAQNTTVGATQIGTPTNPPTDPPKNSWSQLQYEVKTGTKQFTMAELRELTDEEFDYLFGTSAVDPHPELTAEDPDYANPEVSVQGYMVVGVFDYYDSDGDEEETPEIEWSLNKQHAQELDGLVQFSTKNVRSVTLVKGTSIFMTVRANDGKQYGVPVNSDPIAIGNNPPSVSNLKLFGVGNPKSDQEYALNTPNSTHGVKVTYDFTDTDGDVEQGTIIKFFKNGALIKQTTELDPYIEPAETASDGSIILVSNASITAQVIPSDGLTFGSAINSAALVIQGAPPEVDNVLITPDKPVLGEDLRVTFDFFDPDEQANQSRIQWYKNSIEQTDLADKDIVPAIIISVGEVWYAVVTPFDGEDTGTKQRSNTVVIS